jgi:hypothetical protein
MVTLPLEQRVVLLEEEMARLKRALAEVREATAGPWWERIAGTFADDPIYAEAMRLGREHRESLRPKSSRQRR